MFSVSAVVFLLLAVGFSFNLYTDLGGIVLMLNNAYLFIDLFILWNISY